MKSSHVVYPHEHLHHMSNDAQNSRISSFKEFDCVKVKMRMGMRMRMRMRMRVRVRVSDV